MHLLCSQSKWKSERHRSRGPSPPTLALRRLYHAFIAVGLVTHDTRLEGLVEDAPDDVVITVENAISSQGLSSAAPASGVPIVRGIANDPGARRQIDDVTTAIEPLFYLVAAR